MQVSISGMWWYTESEEYGEVCITLTRKVRAVQLSCGFNTVVPVLLGRVTRSLNLGASQPLLLQNHCKVP